MARSRRTYRAPSDHKREEKELDRLWSKFILDRDGRICQSCRRPGNNPHHIFSRRNRSTRHDPENGITLCWACHHYKAHGEPEAFRDFIIDRIGEAKFQALKRRAYEVKNVDHALSFIVLTNHRLGLQ